MQNTTFNTAVANAPAFVPAMPNKNLSTIKHQIRTTRLYMRPVNEEDLIEYIELFSDPKVMRYVGIEAGLIPSFQQIVEMHENAMQTWKIKGFGRWSLFDYKTHEFIGICGFRSDKGNPELICALHERFWGNGLALQAAKACLSYGFETLGLSDVKAYTRPNHTRARKALDKLNAEFLGYENFYSVEGAAYQIHPDFIEF